MEKLGLIITGQLRTFFSKEVQDSFLNFITGLSQKYEIYACLVINEPVIDYDSFLFINKFVKKISIINYTNKHTKAPNIIFHNLLTLQNTIKPLQYYKIINSIPDPFQWLSGLEHQIGQIQVGIKELLSMNILFDVMIKTRFDLIYKIPILPYSNKSDLFPHSKEQEARHLELLEENGFDSFEFLEYISKNIINSYLFIKPPPLVKIGFGCEYHIHKTFLSSFKPKVCMYRDFTIIGSIEYFSKILNFWDVLSDFNSLKDMFLEKEMFSYWAPEALLIIFSYLVDHNPIMYYQEGVVEIQR